MISLVWRSDVHMADLGPVSRTDDWPTTVLSKLDQVARLAKRVNARAIIDGGDFFHVKSPLRNSHEMVCRVAEQQAKHGIPVWANIGNHDCKYGDMGFLGEQPLGVLYETGVFNRLYDGYEARFECQMAVPEPEDEEGAEAELLYLGVYPRSSKIIVRVVGIPYHGTKYDMSRLTSIQKGDEDFLVVAAHLLASPQGGQMFEAEDVVRYSDLADLAPDVWCFGHWHKDQGVTEIAPGKYIVNIGSLTRGSISQDEMARTPACASLRFGPEGIKIEVHPLEVAEPAQVFDLQGRLRTESRDMVMSAFADSIRESLQPTTHESFSQELASMDLPEEVRERAQAYLEAAR